MHCAPRAEEAAPHFSATAAAAARVRAARGRISHAHAARRRRRPRRRGLGATGQPLKARSPDPVAGPSQTSCGGRSSPVGPAPRPAQRGTLGSARSLRPSSRPGDRVAQERSGGGWRIRRLSCTVALWKLSF